MNSNDNRVVDFSKYNDCMSTIRSVVTTCLEAQARNESEWDIDVESVNTSYEDYYWYCKEINQRLKLCDRYLRCNNISEADRLARIEPNLYDLVSTAQSFTQEEWNTWYFVNQELGNGNRYNIDFEIASALITEITDDTRHANPEYTNALESLRLLVVARARLKDRLRVLWKLAKMHIIYEKDLPLWERRRLEEIEEEFQDIRKLVKTDSESAIKQLQDLISELSMAHWRNYAEARRKMISKLNILSDKIAEDLFKKEEADDQAKNVEFLTQMANQIRLAYDNEDENQLRSLIHQWNSHPFRGHHDLSSYLPIVDLATQKIIEFDHNKRYETELTKLKNALSNPKVKSKELDGLASSVQQLGEIPEDVKSLLNSHVNKLDKKKSSFIRTVSLIFFIIVMTLGLSVGYYFYVQYQESLDATKWNDQLSLATEQQEKVSTLVKKLTDELKFGQPVPDLQAVITQIDIYKQNINELNEADRGISQRLADRQKIETEFENVISTVSKKIDVQVVADLAILQASIKSKKSIDDSDKYLNNIIKFMEEIKNLSIIFPSTQKKLAELTVKNEEIKKFLTDKRQFEELLIQLQALSNIKNDSDKIGSLELYIKHIKHITESYADISPMYISDFNKCQTLESVWKSAIVEKNLFCIGWLDYNTDKGIWICQTKWKAGDSLKEFKLAVVTRNQQLTYAKQEVGSVVNGKPVIKYDINKDLQIRGMLIFAYE